MSWTDLVVIFIGYFLFSSKNKCATSKKHQKSEVVLLKRQHIDREEFYLRIDSLLTIASHSYDIADNDRVRDACLVVVDMCHSINSAEKIEDQSHILFNEFYYQKIHSIFEGSKNLHRELCKIHVGLKLKNSIISRFS